MDGKIIKLVKPIEAFGRRITEIALKEPTGALFSRLGQPRIPIYNQSAGSGYFVERDDVITSYLEKLMDMDFAETGVVLQQLSLTDMMELRETLFGFFDAARATSAGAKVAATP